MTKLFTQPNNCAFGYWKITIDKDANETSWKKSTCTCPIYLKQYICKHIISICIALKKVGNQLPPAAKNVPVGDTRKPGRPRLAVFALLEQPQFRSLTDYNDISDLDDDDDDVIQPPSNNTASILTNSQKRREKTVKITIKNLKIE